MSTIYVYIHLLFTLSIYSVIFLPDCTSNHVQKNVSTYVRYFIKIIAFEIFEYKPIIMIKCLQLLREQ